MTNGLNKPTLFVVDDDEAIRDALRTMSESIAISVETFTSAEDFLRTFDRDRPGCVVVDVRMPGIDGLELQDILRERESDLPVVVISGHADVQLAVRAIKAGAVEFLEKPFREQEFLNCIQSAFAQNKQRRESRERISDASGRLERLTPREREVMQLLVVGRSGKQIAQQLVISYKTMEKFRAGVMHKMAAESVADLVLKAVSLGFVSPDGEASPSATD